MAEQLRVKHHVCALFRSPCFQEPHSHAGEPPYAKYRKKVRQRIRAQGRGEPPYAAVPAQLPARLQQLLQRSMHAQAHVRPPLHEVADVLGHLCAARLRTQLQQARCSLQSDCVRPLWPRPVVLQRH